MTATEAFPSGQIERHPTDEQARIGQSSVGARVRFEKNKDGDAESFVDHEKIRPALGQGRPGIGNINAYWGNGRYRLESNGCRHGTLAKWSCRLRAGAVVHMGR